MTALEPGDRVRDLDAMRGVARVVEVLDDHGDDLTDQRLERATDVILEDLIERWPP